MSDENLPPDGEEPGYVTVPAEEEQPIDDTPAEEPLVEDEPPSFEDIASEMGWSPKDKWKGDPDKWKPAHEFVRSTAEINRRLADKLGTFEKQLSSINRTNEAMMERALANQREELLAKRKEAFDTGDYDAMTEVDKKLQQLPTTAPQAPPDVEAFKERNAHWWGKDQEASAWAQQRAGQLAQQGIGPERQLMIVERELGQFFPEYAPQEKPKAKPATLTQPGRRSATKKDLTLSDLPKEAQEAARYFEKKGVPVAEYLKSYKEQEGLS